MIDDESGDFLAKYNGSEGPTRAMVDQELTRKQVRFYVTAGLDLGGLAAGLGIVLTFLFVSAGLIRDGHSVEGTILGSVDIVTLAGLFVTR